MNLSKLIQATLLGAVINFLAGWLLYAVVFKSAMESGMSDAAKAIMLPEDQQKIPMYFVSGLCFSLMLAYVFERWAGIRTWMTGAIAGGIIAALISLNYDFGFIASTSLYNGYGMLFMNAIGSLIMGAVTGAAIGWMLGFNRK
ncbi:MAG: hypothetical protein IT267_09090 [Saprospiraceae bacterium]|nr:hypothetical protein [Saprospiraceae bacterium]